ncbi:MAG: hypothetical protein HQK50_18700 [Oligoflexia bacterium]|nr:hypothetical protein [Oligoflexia bacterium]MBF0367611.1 hypothetical protein [Oligoflexia bacterium]
MRSRRWSTFPGLLKSPFSFYNQIMLSLIIETSPDCEVIGEHLFNKNVIKFGRSLGDILIDEEGIVNGHISLEISEENELLVHRSGRIESYLVNEKVTNASKRLKVGDTITIQKSKIRIKEFKFDTPKSKKEKVRENLAKIMGHSELSPLRKIILELEGDLKKLS